MTTLWRLENNKLNMVKIKIYTEHKEGNDLEPDSEFKAPSS